MKKHNATATVPSRAGISKLRHGFLFICLMTVCFFTHKCASVEDRKYRQRGTCTGKWSFYNVDGRFVTRVYERGVYRDMPINSRRLDNVTRQQCHQQCIQRTEPECRSLDYHATRRICHLHVMSSEQGRYYPRATEKNWTHSEKICKRKPCKGQWTYINIPGVRHVNRGHYRSAPASVERCKEVCLMHSDSICESFTVELFSRFPTCKTSKQYRQTVPNDFVASSNFSYYERTCLPSKRVCHNGTWVMDHVPAWRMTEGIAKVLTNISSAICQKKCAQEEEFDCHSINYNGASLVCELGEEDTETRPYMLRQAGGWMYFEKICVQDKPRFIGFKKILNARWDGNIRNRFVALSRQQCLHNCTFQKACRSANFNRYTKECHLNGGIYFNDVQLFRVKLGWEYHEKTTGTEADTSGVLPPEDLATYTRSADGYEIMRSEIAWKDPNPAPKGDPHHKTKRTWIATVAYADVPLKKQVGLDLRSQSEEYMIYNNEKGPFSHYTAYSGFTFKPDRRYILSVRLRIGNNTSPMATILLQHPKEIFALRPKNVKVQGIGRRSRRGFKAVQVTWDSFSLEWTQFDDEDDDVVGYVVHYKTLASDYWDSIRLDTNVPSTVIHNVSNNTPYLVKVEAITTLEKYYGYKFVSATTSFFTGTLRFASSRMVDCTAVYNEISKKPGLYTIWPVTSPKPFEVLCEKGWTVVQRRATDHRFPFDKDWMEFKTGFTNGTGIYWLGLDKLYYLTNQATYKLTITVELPWNYNRKSVVYKSFRVESESNLYRLHTDRFKGPKGFSDVFDFDIGSYHQRQPFTTRDRDNDRHYENCAQLNGGGWWWAACGWSINAKTCDYHYLRYTPQYCAAWPKDSHRIKNIWGSVMKIKIHNGGRPLQPKKV